MPFNTILLVDDSEAEQFLYTAIIHSYNPDIKVISAYDGQEALEILKTSNDQIDFIFLDINMPRMNGFDFLKKYSQEYKNKQLIISMLTSSIQAKDKEKALAYECVYDFITKPLTAEHLERLSKLIKNQ